MTCSSALSQFTEFFTKTKVIRSVRKNWILTILHSFDKSSSQLWKNGLSSSKRKTFRSYRRWGNINYNFFFKILQFVLESYDSVPNKFVCFCRGRGTSQKYCHDHFCLLLIVMFLSLNFGNDVFTCFKMADLIRFCSFSSILCSFYK